MDLEPLGAHLPHGDGRGTRCQHIDLINARIDTHVMSPGFSPDLPLDELWSTPGTPSWNGRLRLAAEDTCWNNLRKFGEVAMPKTVLESRPSPASPRSPQSSPGGTTLSSFHDASLPNCILRKRVGFNEMLVCFFSNAPDPMPIHDASLSNRMIGRGGRSIRNKIFKHPCFHMFSTLLRVRKIFPRPDVA